jgi:AAA15 family ATPase/GTPase
MINYLYIKNYRIFKELRINKFAKVNLIIGKNNVGKTSLLEAIMLLTSKQNMIYNIFQILSHRKEFLDTNFKTQKLLEILTTLFHNQNVSNESIFIGVIKMLMNNKLIQFT